MEKSKHEYASNNWTGFRSHLLITAEMLELFCVDDKGKDQLIGSVTIEERGGGRTDLALLMVDKKIVVKSYSKDGKILCRSNGPADYQLKPISGHEKILGFGSYLLQRKKAGVVDLPQGGKMFILPMVSSDQLYLSCVVDNADKQGIKHQLREELVLEKPSAVKPKGASFLVFKFPPNPVISLIFV